MSLRLIFMGTPAFSVPVLTALIGQGHDVAAVYTRGPAPGGRRGLEPVKSPVQQVAEKFNIPVFTPKTLRNSEVQTQLAACNADCVVVVAYGMLLPQAILDMPRLGCLNLHASLLPRWRGAAPIQRAIMAGDTQSGVMVMRMEAGLDTGPVGMVERVDILPDMEAGQLHDALMPLGADLMVRALAALERGSLHFTPQVEEGLTYAAKITKEECRITFDKPLEDVLNQIRGLAPFPGAYCEIPDAKGIKRLKIINAIRVERQGEAGVALDNALTFACSSGAIRFLRVQPAGKGAMSAEEFLRGTPVAAGTRVI